MYEIPKEENEYVEFKESLADTSSIVEAVVAFSNSHGGRIFAGITDNGKIKGLMIGRNTLDQLIHKIAQDTMPKIYPNIKNIKIEEKSIIEIFVQEGTDKPYLCKGVGYKRVGRSNVKLDLSELERLILKKHTEKTAFDNKISEAALEDIDEAQIFAFIKEAKIRRKQGFGSEDIQSTLKNLGLLKDRQILNGAVICFGKDPQRFFPQFTFRCVVFKNNIVVNHQLIEGSLFNMIEEVQKFVTFNIQRAYVIKGARREDIFEYPIEAIREGIINAVVHRDYFNNASCYLSIYEDQIEIKNPGLLPEELKINDLKEPGHGSLPRNKLVTRVAHLNGYIEHLGTGTTKIVNMCRAAGLTDPVFEEKQGFFVLSINKRNFRLSDRQKKAVSRFKNKNFKASDYAEYLNISNRTAIEDIKYLIKSGIMLKEGKGKNTNYKLR